MSKFEGISNLRPASETRQNMSDEVVLVKQQLDSIARVIKFTTKKEYIEVYDLFPESKDELKRLGYKVKFIDEVFRISW